MLQRLTVDFGTARQYVDRRVVVFHVGVLVASLPVLPFAWHLGMHVLGAAMLIGNAIVMGVWLTIAGRANRDGWKRRAAHAVNVGDAWFTVPGVVLILANGLAMVFERYGGVSAITSVPFIGIGLVLLTLTGLVWATRLVPAQLELHRIAQEPGAMDTAAYGRTLTGWSIWGVIATALPILAVVVMTTKPGV
jgi:uncharacterized membrane protein